MRGLADKIAIVTGGATLIGARVAKKLADAKVSVLIADIDSSRGLPIRPRPSIQAA